MDELYGMSGWERELRDLYGDDKADAMIAVFFSRSKESSLPSE